jgi:signal transduction histidine kinase
MFRGGHSRRNLTPLFLPEQSPGLHVRIIAPNAALQPTATPMLNPRKDDVPCAHNVCAGIAPPEHRLRELDAFTTAVSHELRDSLFSVGGFARAIELDDTGIGAKSRSRLRRIAQAALRMERVIDDALALARGERFDVEKVDLRDRRRVQIPGAGAAARRESRTLPAARRR